MAAEQAVHQVFRCGYSSSRGNVVGWTAHGDMLAGDRVVHGEGVASAEEEAAVAAVPEAPRRVVPESGEQEVSPARGGGEVAVDADGGRRVEDGELAAIRLGDEEAEEGRRGVALAEAAQEVGA
jgi:hypothetical protein